MLSVCVHFGFGRHGYDITDWPSYMYVANITGVCSIIAAAWSKTSFAITLLRLVREGWMRWLVWFIIASVNIFLGLSCIFTYVQCNPVAKLYDSKVPGVCWPQKVIITYNSFSSCKRTPCPFVIQVLTVSKSSLVRRNGHPPGYTSVVDNQRTLPVPKQQGADWCSGGNEHGKSVSIISPLIFAGGI